MRFLLLLIVTSINIHLFAQADLKQVPVSSLPQDIQDMPNLSMAFRWTDTLGDNVVVISKKIIKNDEEDRVRSKSSNRSYNKQADNFSKQVIPSFAFHYTIVKDSAVFNWKVGGISKTCKGEGVNHTKNWTVFTDLDNDSKAEVWLIYKAECINDDNIGDMKIVMCEGNSRYTMAGDIRSEKPVEANFDNMFRNGQEVYRKYASQLWKQFLKK